MHPKQDSYRCHGHLVFAKSHPILLDDETRHALSDGTSCSLATLRAVSPLTRPVCLSVVVIVVMVVGSGDGVDGGCSGYDSLLFL